MGPRRHVAVANTPPRPPAARQVFSYLDAGTDPDGDVVDAGLTEDEQYVNGLYDLFLGRDATQAELVAGVATVAAGGRGALTTELSTSTEWAGVVIDGIYDNALDRTPDAGGRAFWVDRLDSGSSTAAVSVSIYASPEAVERAGSTEAWVTDLYRRILDRTPDAEGLEFWVESIDSGRLHPAHVVEAFWDSPEFRMMRVRDTYQSVLGRDPDQGGWVYWAGRLSEMDEVRLAAHLAASDEFHQRVTG